MSGKGTLSATNLASAYHLGCDLYLHHVYHRSDIQNSQLNSPSELSKAQFERGNEWEAALFRWLDDENLLLRVGSGPLDGGEILEVIQFDERDHFFVTGLSFWPPKKALATKFSAAGTQPIYFGLAKPDLIEVTRNNDGSITWKVIDAKASTHMKTSHLVQIYFYTMCLSLLLSQPFRPSGATAVWLPPPGDFLSSPPSLHQLKAINFSLLSDSLDKFLFTRLPYILTLPREQVKWHFNPLCQTCHYEPKCRSRAVRERTLGSMPNISLDEANVLESLLAISRRESKSSSGKLTDIEDLHKLFEDKDKIDVLSRSFPSTLRKAKRILGLPNRSDRKRVASSAILEAARTQTVKTVNRRNFTFPRSEDIAIVLSIVPDPASMQVAAYTFSVYSVIPALRSSQPVYGVGHNLVPALASLITTILDLKSCCNPVPTTQFYVFAPAEHTILQRHLIDTALALGPCDFALHAAVRLCIGALSEGASLLSTAFQPLVLSGALLDFLGKKGARKKEELQMCLERLGLPNNGTVEELRACIAGEIERFKIEGGRAPTGSAKMELGQLPRVVIVSKEIGRLLALPCPGYWDLPQCTSLLLSPDPKCPSDEDIFIHFKHGRQIQAKIALQERNCCIRKVIQNLRDRVVSARTGRLELLVNDARVLSAEFMDICKQEHMRKLFFMQQFEVLTKLTELWRSRIDGCPDAPILQYHNSETPSSALRMHSFSLISGALDMPTDKDRSFFDYILAEDCDDTAAGNDFDQFSLPVEALFDDLGVSGFVFPLNRYTASKWNEQHPLVQKNILVADLRNIDIQGHQTMVTLQTWGSFNMKLVKGHHYRLSPRLVDFNLTKVLSTLLELDLRIGDDVAAGSKIPFFQLITNPRSLIFDEGTSSESILRTENTIQSLFRELHDLGSTAAGTLLLKSSQRLAARRILSRRLTVIWGPPGTGKTYTIALAILRLFDARSRLQAGHGRVVFLTAMTHAAIEACLARLNQLVERYRQIPDLSTIWLDKIKIEHVVKGNEHTPPTIEFDYIFAGTVYQLYNFSKRRSFEVDCVVIDEAGQLSLASVALVLRALNSNGRIVVAGDSEQLAPILAGQYPRLKSRLFGSILDCLMDLSSSPHDKDITNTLTGPSSPAGFSEISLSQDSTIVQLTENFRLNPDLGEFVSTIYSRAFKPQKVQARQVATRLKTLGSNQESNELLREVQGFLLALSDVMLRHPQNLLQPPHLDTITNGIDAQAMDISAVPHPISLALIRLQTITTHPDQVAYEVHVRGEAAIAAALVKLLRRSSPSEDIFVATPHRIQRQAVKAALDFEEASLINAMQRINITADASVVGKVTVDTVERLQGSEAAFVICLFSLPLTSSSASTSELTFLLERRRLNVAISRAKTLCILVTSDNVLRPSVKVFSDEGSAKGYAFLRAFEERSWSAPLKVHLDSV